MSFTHGMNIDEVTSQQTEVNNISQDLGTEMTNSQNEVSSFCEESWWGDDSTKFLSDWEEVNTAFQTAKDEAEQIASDIQTQIGDQESTSAS